MVLIVADRIRIRVLAYIRKHWRGELSLAVSFWINFLLFNLIIRLFDLWFTKAHPIENPVLSSRVWLFYTAAVIVMVYPWQIVGLWRCSMRRQAQTGRRLWGTITQVVVVIGVLGTLGNLNKNWPVYRDIYQIAFVADEFSNYQLDLTDDDKLIHLRGGLGFGVSGDVQDLIDSNPAVQGIILDSPGGRIYEGRKLSEIILANGLDTYSLSGCQSACGTAFVSGNRRYLAQGAYLAFHRYRVTFQSLAPYADIQAEEEKDRRIYQAQGIDPDFIDKIFRTKQDDLWYPSLEELLQAGVINEVVDPSDLMSLAHGSADAVSGFRSELEESPIVQTIKMYEPEVHKALVDSVMSASSRGVTAIEVQEIARRHIEALAVKSLSKTSTKALLSFVRETVGLVHSLEKKDPILCIQYLHPDTYGAMLFAHHTTADQAAAMSDALDLVIIDSYQAPHPQIDATSAQILIEEIVLKLGDDAYYMVGQGLQSSAEYSKSCLVTAKFYELFFTYDEAVAANGLRYMFGQAQ